jgi:hypothetical protein
MKNILFKVLIGQFTKYKKTISTCATSRGYSLEFNKAERENRFHQKQRNKKKKKRHSSSLHKRF